MTSLLPSLYWLVSGKAAGSGHQAACSLVGETEETAERARQCSEGFHRGLALGRPSTGGGGVTGAACDRGLCGQPRLPRKVPMNRVGEACLLPLLLPEDILRTPGGPRG